ncbi:hypothetical protein CDD83_5630 [Cordyceps sp. RAO-2017]|nr:hypothetical protein CDD83_5630 [Cordyceps sp. RAO-2017]
MTASRARCIAATGQPPACGLGPYGGKLLCTICAFRDSRARPVQDLRRAEGKAVQDARPHCVLRGPAERRLADPEHRGRQPGMAIPICGHAAARIIQTNYDGHDGLVLQCQYAGCGHVQPIDLLGGHEADAHGSRPVQTSTWTQESAYISVGGLHLIVDVCEGNTVIKFQSTVLSNLHERGGIANGKPDPLVSARTHDTGAFDQDVCSLRQKRCACQAPQRG